jgi:hypothetical protein
MSTRCSSPSEVNMTCSCADSPSVPAGPNAMASFDVLWPVGWRFPPSMPWLGSVVDRSEAAALFREAITSEASVQTTGYLATLSLTGRFLHDQGAFRAARQRMKRRHRREAAERCCAEAHAAHIANCDPRSSSFSCTTRSDGLCDVTQHCNHRTMSTAEP